MIAIAGTSGGMPNPPSAAAGPASDVTGPASGMTGPPPVATGRGDGEIADSEKSGPAERGLGALLPNAERGDHREQLEERDAEEDAGEEASIHQPSEDDRSDREPRVEPGVDESVDAAEGALAEARDGDRAHQKVA